MLYLIFALSVSFGYLLGDITGSVIGFSITGTTCFIINFCELLKEKQNLKEDNKSKNYRVL